MRCCAQPTCRTASASDAASASLCHAGLLRWAWNAAPHGTSSKQQGCDADPPCLPPVLRPHTAALLRACTWVRMSAGPAGQPCYQYAAAGGQPIFPPALPASADLLILDEEEQGPLCRHVLAKRVQDPRSVAEQTDLHLRQSLLGLELLRLLERRSAAGASADAGPGIGCRPPTPDELAVHEHWEQLQSCWDAGSAEEAAQQLAEVRVRRRQGVCCSSQGGRCAS